MRIVIIGNCQAGVVAACLQRMTECRIAGILDINHIKTESFTKTLSVVERKEYDVILTHNISNKFNKVNTTQIKNDYNNVFSFTNIYFGGLHPDIVVVGGFNKRLLGKTNALHSKIVLSSYLKRIPSHKVASYFRGNVYERLGYFDAYSDSLEELRRRDLDVDISCSDDLAEVTKNEISMFTVNHPTNHTIMAVTQKIAAALGMKMRPLGNNSFDNPLSRQVVWPIYPEIAEAARLPYRTPLVWRNQLRFKNDLTIEQFIEESYNLYDKTNFNEYLTAQEIQDLVSMDI